MSNTTFMSALQAVSLSSSLYFLVNAIIFYFIWHFIHLFKIYCSIHDNKKTKICSSKTNISSDLQKNTHLYVSQHDQEQVAGLYGMCVIWHVMIIGRCRTGDSVKSSSRDNTP